MEKYDEKTFLELCKTADLERQNIERVMGPSYETPESKMILNAIVRAHKEKTEEKPKETFYQKVRRAAFRIQLRRGYDTF